VHRSRRRPASQIRLWESSGRFWAETFYDFNVFREARRIEKRRYMHDNRVKRGLVDRPELRAWSSYRAHAFGEHGQVNRDWLCPPPRLTTKGRFRASQVRALACSRFGFTDSKLLRMRCFGWYRAGFGTIDHGGLGLDFTGTLTGLARPSVAVRAAPSAGRTHLLH